MLKNSWSTMTFRQKVTLVRALMDGRRSMTQAARMIGQGVTRSEVAGVIYRARQQGFAPIDTQPPQAPPRPRPQKARPKAVYQPLWHGTPVWSPLPGTTPVTLNDRGKHGCAWPVTVDGKTLFCNCPVNPDSKLPYCGDHLAMYRERKL